ncbi:Trafficking protein particle complex II-specific subunit 120-like [Vitis vinifera]|uniref:Trafficking protein particle complex II-specific subunit 120-like n=1 Tax=Vitis vinifera TaxID=29760 RepID=A0A438F1N7_VITVI|nr:Trafficking protein particle complex II-specific subunit 120-like [Vitis vinifera]
MDEDMISLLLIPFTRITPVSNRPFAFQKLVYCKNFLLHGLSNEDTYLARVSPLSFELEATLKLARFLCRRELAKEVVELLTAAADGAKSLIDASDRLILYVEIARLFGTLGYHRKAAFFSRQVAQLYLQQENGLAAISAMQVLAMTTKAYRVQSRASDSKHSLPSVSTLVRSENLCIHELFVVVVNTGSLMLLANLPDVNSILHLPETFTFCLCVSSYTHGCNSNLIESFHCMTAAKWGSGYIDDEVKVSAKLVFTSKSDGKLANLDGMGGFGWREEEAWWAVSLCIIWGFGIWEDCSKECRSLREMVVESQMVISLSLEGYCTSLSGVFQVYSICGRRWGKNSVLGRLGMRDPGLYLCQGFLQSNLSFLPYPNVLVLLQFSILSSFGILKSLSQSRPLFGWWHTRSLVFFGMGAVIGEVVPAGSFSGEGSSRVGEEAGGTVRELSRGSQREKVEQLRLQQGESAVSACGGVSTLCPAVLYVAGDEVEGRVGSADGQGSFKGTQEDLGCDLRPNVSYGEKGEGFGSVGPDAAEGGDLNGEGFSSPRARAQSPGVEKGSGVADSLVRGEAPSASRPSAQLFSSERRAFIVEDPIVDNMRAASQSVAFAVPKMTDQALRDEASRYVGLPSVGGRESSPSSLSSGIDRAGTNEGVSSGLISEIEGEEQLPLSIILADGCNGEMGPGGERPSGDEGRGDEFEILLQDLEGRGCRWDDSCLARFSKFLGFSTEGFEGEILNLLLRNKRRREQNIKKDISGSTKFDRSQRADLVCLQETKIQDISRGIVHSLGVGRFLGWGAMSARGAAGGVVVFWDKRVLELMGMEVGLFSVSCRFKNCEDGFLWTFTGVYGPTIKRHRELFWEELGAIRGLWSDPWCIGGDFNVVRFPSERSRVGRLTGSMRRFSEVIEELALKDLPLHGGLFTWSGGLNGLSRSRLDRFLISEDWENHFSGASQCSLPRPVSDHFPILLDGGGTRRGPIPFRFENMWLKEEGFKELLKGWWQGFNYSGSYSFILTEKLKALKIKLKEWNSEVFGKVGVNKGLALDKVSYWDNQEQFRALNEQELEARKEAREEFKKWALMEETSWRQNREKFG